MTSVLAGVLGLLLAVLIQRLALVGRARILRRDEQAFVFHALRDDLQLIAADGIIRQDDPIYQFLFWATNIGIRNAGTLSVREAMKAARQIEANMPGAAQKATWEEFSQQIEARPEAVRRAAGRVLNALAWMMVSNDSVVRSGLSFAMAAARANRVFKPFLLWTRRSIDRLATHIAPNRAKVVRQARDYHDFGDRLAA